MLMVENILGRVFIYCQSIDFQCSNLNVETKALVAKLFMFGSVYLPTITYKYNIYQVNYTHFISTNELQFV